MKSNAKRKDRSSRSLEHKKNILIVLLTAIIIVLGISLVLQNTDYDIELDRTVAEAKKKKDKRASEAECERLRAEIQEILDNSEEFLIPDIPEADAKLEEFLAKGCTAYYEIF
jgi:hypothetical protein